MPTLKLEINKLFQSSVFKHAHMLLTFLSHLHMGLVRYILTLIEVTYFKTFFIFI